MNTNLHNSLIADSHPWPGDHEPFGLHSVFAGELCCGLVTSAARGHRIGKTLAFAYLRTGTTADELSVSICGERVAATVLHRSPYDPENRQLRLAVAP